MNKSGIGIGSASVVLVFAVLCLTVFALISYTAASNDRALADVEADLVKNYYAADTLAELILAELSAANGMPNMPGELRGVKITAVFSELGEFDEPGARTAEFSCPVSGSRELYVKAVIYGDSYGILSWRMRSTAEGEAEADKSLPVWTGE